MVRTRFAPSPTGALHAGTVRTALFAWLTARHGGGQFLLRIEDTDQTRGVEGAVSNIIDSLHYLGLDWDEGPDEDGEYGPYIQSQRLNIYKEWAQKLIDKGRAYSDPYTKDELDEFRAQAVAQKKPFVYRDHRPADPPAWNGSTPLRFKSEPKAYKWHDEVMGDLSTGPEVVDDFILIKSDSYPTYNFAHIIDDHLMQISHVVRSQEFISSMPIFLNLYDALGFDYPVFATVPLVLATEGNKKLSKREGAKQLLDYQKMGILPEALMNCLATTGWNDGSEQEIFSRDELIAKFDLGRVQKSGARFDEQRLLWMDGHYIRQTPLEALYAASEGFWPASAAKYDNAYKKQVLGLIQERLKYLAEIPALSQFFFEDLPIDRKLIDENKQLQGLDRQQLRELLGKSQDKLAQTDFSVEKLTQTLNGLLQETGQKPGVLFSLIRVATTWAPASPGLAETLSLLGKDKTLARLHQTIESLS